MKKASLIILLVVLALSVSACSVSLKTSDSGGGSSDSNANVGGVFVSANRGDTWTQFAYGPTISGRPKDYTNLSATYISSDPQDAKAIYLGTAFNGLLYTYNVNNGWMEAQGLPEGQISDVEVDPKNQCAIYVAIANKLYRSLDCSRNFKQMYMDNNSTVSVTTIAIDHYNNNNIYIGTSRGDIIKSIDQGNSWRAIQRLDGDSVARIMISPLDSRLVFVVSAKNRFYSFSSNTITNANNSGDVDANFAVVNWQDLSAPIRDFNIGTSFRDAKISKDGTIFLATAKAIVRSSDNGVSWENLELVTPEKDATINSIGFDPNNTNELYYVTNTTFFRSLDGGVSWTTKKLPTSRAGAAILVDSDRPNVIYLGIKALN